MHPAKPHRVLNLIWRGCLFAALCQFLATTALYAQISNASINGAVRVVNLWSVFDVALTVGKVQDSASVEASSVQLVWKS
jgi:hypothetical protein